MVAKNIQRFDEDNPTHYLMDYIGTYYNPSFDIEKLDEQALLDFANRLEAVIPHQYILAAAKMARNIFIEKGGIRISEELMEWEK